MEARIIETKSVEFAISAATEVEVLMYCVE